MEFRILGPLEASGDSGPLQLTGGKQKALLALLLLHAGRAVPMTQLVDDLWGEAAPDSAQKMVQIFVSQLRKHLPEGTLRTVPPGYLADIEGHSLDLRRFEELVAWGRTALAQGRAPEALQLLDGALSLWRGPALGEFDEPFAQAESARLEELHITCLEDRIDALLALGRHQELVAELDSLVGRYSHRERLRAQLMLALYRSGRQAEALEAYQAFRRRLDDDLGIAPSSALKDLERRMLQQDPELDVEVQPEVAPAPPAAHQPPPDEMLKLVTIVYADVSTRGTEGMHPEDLRSVLGDCFDALAAEVTVEGGKAERLVGNALLAVFGVPVAREDDAVRAVRTAIRLGDRLDDWNRANGLSFRLFTGVDTGEVIVAEDGEIVGDTIAGAVRLQQAAGAGEILVGERTARAARSRFSLSPVDDSWRVAGELEAPSPPSGLRAPLIGRELELASLRSTFERVQSEERPSLVTLIGDAGIGKSRLAAEFCAPLGEGGAAVLVGRCLPSGQGVALAPLAEMLNAQAGVFETDSDDLAIAKVGGLVRSLVGEDAAQVEAALESSLGLRRGDDALATLEPRARFREVIAAWRALLAALGRRSAVIVVVEDLHWADPTLLETLDELADSLTGRVFFLCTARPDLLRSRPDWGGGRRSFSALPLDPLSAEQAGTLIASLLDVGSLSEGARRQILARSEGNPFFLEEIVRNLIDEGLLEHDGTRWHARVQIDAIELPDSIQAVILARLDLLTPDERRVAQRASVVGRRFWDGALTQIPGVDDLDAVLRTLRRREFVVERVSSAVAGEREFVFKHVLIRDVAYESLPRAERGRAHVETAHWIEHTIAERAGERAEMLAHHYDAAYAYVRSDELRRIAREHLCHASVAAHRRFAIDEGDRLARRAVALSETGQERLEALETLADLHYLSGDAAWRAYTDALAELSPDDPAVARLAGKAAEFACRWVGTMLELPGVEDVKRVIDTGMRVAVPGSAEHALLLVDAAYLAVQRENRRDEAARRLVDETVEAAEALGDPDVLSAALDVVQAAHMQVGAYGEMYRSALRRLELVDQLTDAREIGDAHAMAAWSAQYTGRFRESEAHATAASEPARTTDAGSYLHGLTWRVGARFMLGDWDSALADQDEIERVLSKDARELPASFTMHAYTQAALCHDRRGNTKRADEYLELSYRYLESRKTVDLRAPLLASPALALLLARRGEFDGAIGLLTAPRHTGASGTTLSALCEITADRAAWDGVPVLLADAREEAAAGELRALTAYADRLEGRSAAAGGDTERAVAMLRRSAVGFAELEARWEEAWSRLLLGEVLLASDSEAARRELDAALSVFDELGSVREAERAREPLAV